MRINTNVAALNTQRVLNQTSADAARSMARLSSGFRINKAADDAAGLGIANKIRADLRGLKQASRNAEQANSLLQVAEGGAQTIQSIVDRMKELAVQSASDNVNDTDRAQIQAEFSQLQQEITRVVSTTKFQGSTLLNASLGNFADLANASTTLDTAAGFAAARVSGTKAATYTFTQTAGAVTVSGNNRTQTVTVGAAGAQTINFDVFGLSIDTTASFSITGGSENLTGDLVVGGGNTSFMVSISGQQGSGGAAGNDDIGLGTLDLTLSTLGLNADSLATKSAAQATIGHVDSTALVKLADAFGNIGAAQNRIDFASSNTKTAIENLSAAESTIRDADMAEEMSNFTKTQILQQAGTAMLAQANSAPQLVLKLLG